MRSDAPSWPRHPTLWAWIALAVAAGTGCSSANTTMPLDSGTRDSGGTGGGRDAAADSGVVPGADSGQVLDSGPAQSPDSGTIVDAGARSDSGSGGDVGSGLVDSGESADSTVPSDSGAVLDSGSGSDGAQGNDAMTPEDGGTLEDGGTPADAQAVGDAGTAADAGTMPPMCDPSLGTNACGGDPTGTWDYRGACSNDPLITQGSGLQTLCPGATVGTTAYASGGTLVIAQDGTYQRNVDAFGTQPFSVPSACAQPVGGCDGLASTLMQASPGYSYSCTASATGCDCTVSRHFVTMDTGTWQASGNIITANGTPYYFCATTGTLEYRQTMSNGMDPTITYTLTRH